MYGYEHYIRTHTWCQGAQNVGLSNRKLKSTLICILYDHNARPSQTDRRTDEIHGNTATIRSNERIAYTFDMCTNKVYLLRPT